MPTTLDDFDLGGVVVDAPDLDGLIDTVAPQPTEKPSETALKLDKWSIRQGLELTQDKDYQAAAGGAGAEDKFTAADMLAAAFDPDPELAGNCASPTRAAFMSELLNTPDWQVVRASSVLDENASAIAACACRARYAKLVQDKIDAEDNGKEWDEELESMKAASQATAEAATQVEEYGQAVRAMGGLGQGGGTVDPRKAAELFQRVKNSRKLRHICELAGKYQRLGASCQQRKSIYGQEEVVGITTGGDVGRLVPSEMAMLMSPATRPLVERRIIENQAMVREFHGTDSVAKGPVVFVVDESGSMAGTRVANAKAMALAMAQIARTQGRWCALVGFSGGEDGTRIALPPGQWDEAGLIDWLEHFYNGGTTCDVPLVQLPTVYWQELDCPRGKTDVVIVTDGLVDIPDQVRENFNTWRKLENCNVQVVIIGEDRAGDLEKVADRVHLMPALTVESEGVEDILSI
jgi:uncharacterized protein with von Willebrand factor type A (vWA) domain